MIEEYRSKDNLICLPLWDLDMAFKAISCLRNVKMLCIGVWELEDHNFGFQRIGKYVGVQKQRFGLKEFQKQVFGIKYHRFCKRIREKHIRKSVLSGKTILVNLKHGEWGKEKKSLIKVKKVSVITVAKVVTTNDQRAWVDWKIKRPEIVEGVWRKFY